MKFFHELLRTGLLTMGQANRPKFIAHMQFP